MSIWTLTTLPTREVVSLGLHDAIVEFDKRNMAAILAEAGMAFPEAKRRKAFECDGVFIIAFDSGRNILGYLELCPDWECPADDIYISSLQIAPSCRTGTMLRRIMQEAIKHLRNRSFRYLKTAVQKNNHPAIRMYRSLGFSFADNPKSEKSFLLNADRGVLDTPIARRLAKYPRGHGIEPEDVSGLKQG